MERQGGTPRNEKKKYTTDEIRVEAYARYPKKKKMAAKKAAITAYVSVCILLD